MKYLRYWIFILAIFATLALLFLERESIYRVLQGWIDSLAHRWWAKLDEQNKGLTGSVLMPGLNIFLELVVPITLAFMAFLRRRSAPAAKIEPNFPFERFSSSDIQPLKKLRSVEVDLPYQPRFPHQQQREFEKSLDCKFLLLRGRAGLGKTRECIELFARLAKVKGEEITILYPHEDFDRPSNVPVDFVPRTLVLFIDSIEQLCTAGPISATDSSARSFHDRLAATIEWMKERYAGKDWRIVLTLLDGPEASEKLEFDDAPLSMFKKVRLPDIDRDVRPRFVRAAAKYFDFEMEEEAISDISKKSDGTCLGIITPLVRERELSRGSRILTAKDVERYSFQYPSDWNRVVKESISPFPNRRVVFQTLSALEALRIRPHISLVEDIAARLYRPGYFYSSAKPKIIRTIRRDLRAWMYEYRGEVICPTAYLDKEIDAGAVLSDVVSGLLCMARRQAFMNLVLPALAGIGYRISIELARPREALRLLRGVAKHAPHAAQLWIVQATILGQLGERRESLRAATTAVQIDGQNSRALIALAFAQSQNGLDGEAVRTSLAATECAPSDDFAWLNLGVVLGKLHRYGESIAALREACALNPQSARAWYSLGLVYDRNKQPKQAIEACLKATELDPGDADAWHTLGIAYDRDGDLGNAITALRTARRLDTDSIVISLSLGRSLLSERRSDEAASVLRGAEEKARNDANFLCKISRAYGVGGRYRDAVRAAESALKVEPNHDIAKRCLARNLRLASGGLVRASRDLVRASNAYYGQGDYAQAIAAASDALLLDQNSAEAWKSLAVNSEQLGKLKEAGNAWRRYYQSKGNVIPSDTMLIQAKQDVVDSPNVAQTWKRFICVCKQKEEARDGLAFALTVIKREPGACCHAFELAKEFLTTETAAVEDFLSHLVAVDDSNSNYISLRGVARRKLGDPVKAVNDGLRACELDSEDKNKWYALGNAFKDWGKASKNCGKLFEAAAAYTKAMERGHKKSEAWYDLGEAFENCGELDAAANAYTKAVELGNTAAPTALKCVLAKLALTFKS
jgi:tetratricopeptide (TPR) repeat protein